MKEEFCERGIRAGRKKSKKKKERFIRFVLLLSLCILSFIGGRVTADAANREPSMVKWTVNQPVDTSLAGIYHAEWNLTLINSQHPILEGLSVKLMKLKNGQSIDERAYSDLQAMMDDARTAGLSPIICSSYRTMEKQTVLFNQQVDKYLEQGYSGEAAKAEAGKWVAAPGTSEHQTGLAVDIVAKSYQSLDKQQETTAEQLWLMRNCYKYGFILRYPEEKSDITGISYEPWHYRYVGKEAAKEIMEKGICLEEYLKR